MATRNYFGGTGGSSSLPPGGSDGTVLAYEDGNAVWVIASQVSHGLPAGGTSGQMLVKVSDADFDANWTDAATGQSTLPTGGAEGQVLGVVNGELAWIDPPADGVDGVDGTNGVDGADGADGAPGPGVAPGGTTGQVLRKRSNADYDTEWITSAVVPATGASGQVLGGGINNVVAWTVGGTAGQVLTKSVGGSPSWTSAGLPTGGTSGQMLAKNSGTNYDTTWVAAPKGVPDGGSIGTFLKLGDGFIPQWATIREVISGGSNGQALRRTAPTGSYAWADVHEVPPGGTTGQVLAKAADTDYALSWTTPAGASSSTVLGVPTGGTAGQILTKNGPGDSDYAWQNSAAQATDLMLTDATGTRWQLAVSTTGALSTTPVLTGYLPWKFDAPFNDDFSRSDRNLAGDNGWLAFGGGTPAISNGGAIDAVGPDTHLLRNAGRLNHGIAADMWTNPGADMYLVVRSNADFNNCLMIGMGYTNGVSMAFHKIGGTYTGFGNLSAVPWVSGDRLRALVVDNRILYQNLTKNTYVYVDIPAAAQSALTGTYVGIRFSAATASSGERVDNVTVYTQADA